MTKRRGDNTPEPPGGRAAERLKQFLDARIPHRDQGQDDPAQDTRQQEPDPEEPEPGEDQDEKDSPQ